MEAAWDFYFSAVDDRPISIYLDLHAMDEESRSQRPVLLFILVSLRQPNSRGMSTIEESNTLYAIEDALAEQLGPLGAQFVARVTGQGRRDFFYYVPTESDSWATSIGQAMAGFPGYEYKIGVKPDAEWSLYRTTLYPSERDWQPIKDRQVLASLKEHGDTLEIPRFLNHWVYFAAPAARQAFVDQTEARGFVTKNLHEADKGELRHCAVLERKDSVQDAEISAVTLELFDLAQSYGGCYDGWESKVITSPEEAEEY